MEQIYFGQRISALRKARGMTQESLAQKLGITNQAVSKWESDQCCPDIMQLPVLADIFEISLDALFGREMPQPQAEPTVIHDLPWEDGNDLHAVCYVGHRLVSFKDIPSVGGKRGMFSFSCMGFEKFAAGPVMLEYSGDVDNVYSDYAVRCTGDVRGNVQAGDSVNCGSVTGNVFAGSDISCTGNIGINAQAGGDIHCDGMIGGSANAGGDIECGDIGGRVQCDGDIECRGNINGSVKADGDIKCFGSISGSAVAEGDIYYNES